MRHLIWIVLATTLLAACGSASPPESASSERITMEPQRPGGGHVEIASKPAFSAAPNLKTKAGPACNDGDRVDMRGLGASYAAYVRSEDTPVRARPAGKTLVVLGPTARKDVPTVLGVLGAVVDAGCNPAWYQVQLAVWPNGSTGYVAADAVALRKVAARIEVDLSDRTLELYRDGKRVLRTPVTVGAEITPTPTGQYFVNERWIVNDSWGAFGPRALGISAHSPVLRDWAEGGPIGIHGTNQPSLLGQAVSHGCIRLQNEVMLRLFGQAPAGTPVTISA